MSIDYGKRITEESFHEGRPRGKKVWEKQVIPVTNPISLQSEINVVRDMVVLGKTYDINVRIFSDKYSKKPIRLEKTWLLPDES